MYTAQLNTIEGLLRGAELSLAALQAFDGTVILPGGLTTTPELLNARSMDFEDQQRTIYAAANSSWAIIQNMTEAVQMSNGSVKVFVARVKAAMNILQEARNTRDATEIILSGNFADEHANNSGELQILLVEVEKFPEVVQNAQRLLDQGKAYANQANVTIDEADLAVKQKLAENAAKFLESQISKFNASQAQAAAETARAIVNVLEVCSFETLLKTS